MHGFGCELRSKTNTSGLVSSQTAVSVYSQALLPVAMFTLVVGIQLHDLIDTQFRHTLYVVLTTMR